MKKRMPYIYIDLVNMYKFVLAFFFFIVLFLWQIYAYLLDKYNKSSDANNSLFAFRNFSWMNQ